MFKKNQEHEHKWIFIKEAYDYNFLLRTQLYLFVFCCPDCGEIKNILSRKDVLE